jgi:benzoyl-CoA reductase/2-hydroxyglutaryl-CoA dehydratase subunit BcrC/BadD/HgdB
MGYAAPNQEAPDPESGASYFCLFKMSAASKPEPAFRFFAPCDIRCLGTKADPRQIIRHRTSSYTMKIDELLEELSFHTDDLEDTVHKSQAVRSFIDQKLLPEHQAVDEQIDLLHQLIQKSAAMSDLISEFLDSSPHDAERVNTANQIVSAAKDEIAAYNHKKFIEHIKDIIDETDGVQ